MNYVIAPASLPALRVADSTGRFPLRRVFCVGRNYVSHQIEMGGTGREAPFFFAKSPHAVVPGGGPVHYPPQTKNLHHEVELVIAIGRGGSGLEVSRALDHVYGYGVGLDLTRRDLQQTAKERGRPWLFAKDFDEAAPCSELYSASAVGHPERGAISLAVNGELRQHGDLADMIWKASEQIAFLSTYYRLEPGDLIFAGTPAGVGAVHIGDHLHAAIEGLAELDVTIVPPS
jgi:fumarylpyruvate hydrolase